MGITNAQPMRSVGIGGTVGGCQPDKHHFRTVTVGVVSDWLVLRLSPLTGRRSPASAGYPATDFGCEGRSLRRADAAVSAVVP